MADGPGWRERLFEPFEAGIKRLFPDYGSPIIPVVRLSGTIGRVSRFQSGLTLSGLAPLPKKAFAVNAAAAVPLIINSPGGSPVQSHLIYKRIRALAEQHEKTVLAFAE